MFSDFEGISQAAPAGDGSAAVAAFDGPTQMWTAAEKFTQFQKSTVVANSPKGDAIGVLPAATAASDARLRLRTIQVEISDE